MVKIAITGAAGNVGRAILDGFDEHHVRAFTHRRQDDLDSEVLDVTKPDDVMEKLSGFDIVAHLAGASSPSADWDTVVDVNVRGTQNVYEAAVEHGIRRVVFASSNHAVGTYNIDAPADPESMRTDDVTTIDPDAPPRPDSFYGVSKVACEALGNYYAIRHGVEVVNLRIGWYLSTEDLAGTQDQPESKARFARAMWLSGRDCRDVVAAAATAPLAENPVTVNAVSRNDDRSLSITTTMRAIGYRPRDNASEVLDAE